MSPSCVQNFEVVPRRVENVVRSWLKISRKSDLLVILRGCGT